MPIQLTENAARQIRKQLEKRGRGVFLQATPIEVSTIVAERLFSQVDTVVLTSATLVGMLLSTLATGRADFTHLIYLSPLFFLVLAWIVDGRDIPSSFLHAVQPVLGTDGDEG